MEILYPLSPSLTRNVGPPTDRYRRALSDAPAPKVKRHFDAPDRGASLSAVPVRMEQVSVVQSVTPTPASLPVTPSPCARTLSLPEEPLLQVEDNSRYCLYPIRHLDIWEFYKNHQRTFWTAEEIDMTIDKNDWSTRLSQDERWFIEHILAFFASSDGIVLENLVTHLCQEINIPEARCFYSFQAMMENVHSEVYSLMIDTFVSNAERKQMLFDAIDEIPCVRKKADWALRWISRKSGLGQRLVAFAIVEGLFFSGSFCAIFWLKERGLLVNSLGKSNEWISRDEGLHTLFAVHLYNNYIQNKMSAKDVYTMMREAVALENEFLCDALPVRLIGMNGDMMTEYIRFVADWLLVQLQLEPIFHARNPFPFMAKIGLEGKTNFFEQRVSEYAKGAETLPTDMTFSTCQEDDEEF